MARTELKDGDELVVLPSGMQVLYRDASHRYWCPLEPLDTIEPGRKIETAPLIGVTTVTGCLDKPALLPWVEEQTCEALFEPNGDGQAIADFMPKLLSAEELIEVLRQAKLGWRYTRDAAAQRGSSVHAALKALAKKGTVPKLSNFPEEDQGYVKALIRFWLDAQPEVEEVEAVVASEHFGMAGRFDLTWRNSETRTLCVNAEAGEVNEFEPAFRLTDLKTGSGIYPTEQFTQLAGYEMLRGESGYQPTDEQLVLRLDKSGAYEVAVSTATEADFLAVRDVHIRDKRLKASRPKPRKKEQVTA